MELFLPIIAAMKSHQIMVAYAKLVVVVAYTYILHTYIHDIISCLRFATLSVEDGDKGGGGGGGGGEGGETSKRQKRGGKGMVKVKKKEADKAEKKIQGLMIDTTAKLGI